MQQEEELQLQLTKAKKAEQRQQGIKEGFKAAEATAADMAISKIFLCEWS